MVDFNAPYRDPFVVGTILTALAIVLITILYFFISGRRRGRVVLFVGPSEAGKTSLFVHLLNKSGVETVTSTVANIGEYVADGGKGGGLLLKDLPGADRVRNRWWTEHKKGMGGIVVVVDSAGGSKAIREAADVLYTLLTDSTVNSVRPNILILANKQDQLLAKGEQVIKSQLEKEITTLRLTRSASLGTTSGGGGGGEGGGGVKVLGKANQDFQFEHVAPIQVDFGRSCGKPDEPLLSDLVDWLDSIA